MTVNHRVSFYQQKYQNRTLLAQNNPIRSFDRNLIPNTSSHVLELNCHQHDSPVSFLIFSSCISLLHFLWLRLIPALAPNWRVGTSIRSDVFSVFRQRYLLPVYAMGACLSSGGFEVTDTEKALHKRAEKELKEVPLLAI